MPSDFCNLVTQTAYRLRISDNSWRISQIRTVAGQPVLRHLRGIVGPGIPPDDIIDALVFGMSREEPVAADPEMTFAEIVLSELNRTYVMVMTLVRESQDEFTAGKPGFRPKCGALRQQRDRAMAQTSEACLEMAKAWVESGLTVASPPDWLAAAVEDVAATAGSGPVE